MNARERCLTPAEKGEKIARADSRLTKATFDYRIAVDDFVEGRITNREARNAERRLETARRNYEKALEA